MDEEAAKGVLLSRHHEHGRNQAGRRVIRST
jgi:hypothetical protein